LHDDFPIGECVLELRRSKTLMPNLGHRRSRVRRGHIAVIEMPAWERQDMSDQGHIVVVDDEKDVRETFGEYLESRGYEVSLAESGAALRECVARKAPDLVLLDLNLPGEDGLSLARFLREETDSAFIMVTAADDTIDRVIGLELGADDYVGKPVDLRELAARVKTVLRRSAKAAPIATPDAGDVRKVAFGNFVLDLDGHELTDRNGANVELTTMEFDLLAAFVERPNRVLTRDQLLDMAHHRRWDPYDRSIDIRIARLRRKIERDPQKPEIIKTVRGAGYIFIPDGKGPDI
jgi:two-component system phosphate regulon response regulator OmpR